MGHGAKLGRRTLHRAVQSAAYSESESRAGSMEMVRFLVEEIGVDVNGMDAPKGEKWGNHWGTPVAYAAIMNGGGEVVRYLLEVSFSYLLWELIGLQEWDETDELNTGFLPRR